MKMKCFGCGAEKDLTAKELYPFPEDGLISDEPIDPLFVLCCEGWDEHSGVWKQVVVCHVCFHKLEPDMWISSNCWATINPKVRFEGLPDHDHANCGNDDPTIWAHVVVP